MIGISLSKLIVLVMLIGVVFVAVLWIHSLWQDRRREVRRRRIALQCRICGHVYANTPKDTVTTCPSCGSRNERQVLRPI